MRESIIEKEVCEWAKENDILAIKFTPMGEAGWPDRIFLWAGKAAFIEFKAPGQKARPLQEHRIRTLRDEYFRVGVIDNAEDGIAFLEAAFLSGAGRKDNDKPSECRIIDGPWTRKD